MCFEESEQPVSVHSSVGDIVSDSVKKYFRAKFVYFMKFVAQCEILNNRSLYIVKINDHRLSKT